MAGRTNKREEWQAQNKVTGEKLVPGKLKNTPLIACSEFRVVQLCISMNYCTQPRHITAHSLVILLHTASSYYCTQPRNITG
jgi:hypothetical protein